MPDDKRQGERRKAQEDDDNEGGAEIKGQGVGRLRGQRRWREICGALAFIEEFSAVLALDRFVLDFLGAERAFLHKRQRADSSTRIEGRRKGESSARIRRVGRYRRS